ncbi:hypothetical protein Taro_016179 [Colocasia esculenta]|uniref:Uncharacterized protein n=1 Tax=Colocasia esculenta TaxID=4460 RepID=A0A843UMV5_COLES|nr:hypothetical protein [Colocasia esculenta]
MVLKKSVLMRIRRRIAKEVMSEERMERLLTLPLPPNAKEANLSVPAPEVEEDTGPRNPPVIKASSSMEIYVKDRDHMAFRECHKMLMKSTPFSFYVDNTSSCAFSMRMLENIISTHVCGNIFLLGKKEVLFTVEDVGIILGLPSFGHPVRHYGSSKKKFRLHERFGVATNFDRKKVHSLIQQLVIKNLTIERNEWKTIYKGNQTVSEETSTVPPAAASLSLLQEIAASIKSQEVKFDQLSTHLNDQMRQIEEIMRYIHKRDEPMTHDEGAAGPTPTFSEHVHV